MRSPRYSFGGVPGIDHVADARAVYDASADDYVRFVGTELTDRSWSRSQLAKCIECSHRAATCCSRSKPEMASPSIAKTLMGPDFISRPIDTISMTLPFAYGRPVSESAPQHSAHPNSHTKRHRRPPSSRTTRSGRSVPAFEGSRETR